MTEFGLFFKSIKLKSNLIKKLNNTANYIFKISSNNSVILLRNYSKKASRIVTFIFTNFPIDYI